MGRAREPGRGDDALPFPGMLGCGAVTAHRLSGPCSTGSEVCPSVH
ncbi:MAG: hypothetical protein AVDCRST_MAG66-1125 [uncultured Pseudonocardia sp.]|uniref:Uncharacterized protein n=1 Tax=uncultured Pseudonocardia sp. TaxID=211455 RepID=A0A6J4NUP6_9PSEU|nr:MAG: hypothetical protein AVDCRST_MAG66-1125 [uncultured Pseudonocardia sp.]